jgi:hypothetical protein
MYPSEQVIDPVAVRMRERRAQWEKERLAELREFVKLGLYTKAEAKERRL